MKRRGLAGLLLSAAAATGLALATTAAPASAANLYQIQNYGSGMCLQPPPGNISDTGVQLVQEPCNGQPEQKWSPTFLFSGRYRFTNASTGGCLDAHGRDANRTPVDTWPCSGISNQTWAIGFSLPNSVPRQIISKVSEGSRCLDVAGGSLEAGAPIQIYTCTNDNTAQAWLVQPVG
jgi:hypothetical protein